ALFLLIGMMYERRHSREMADYGGIAKTMPVLTFFMVFTALASAGLPGLNGFVGEFMILIGSFKSTVIDSPLLVALATSGVILAAMYLLFMIYSTFFGEVTSEEVRALPDLNAREVGILVPLAALMIIMGFLPTPFLKQSELMASYLLDTIEEKRTAALLEAEQPDPHLVTAPLTFDGSQFHPSPEPETPAP
ncbi:MAG: proton-conducting transporter membrane subunit, partial [Bacteroidota bacterium]